MATVPKELDFTSQLLYPRPGHSSDSILFIRIELPGSAQLTVTFTRREGRFTGVCQGTGKEKTPIWPHHGKTRWYHNYNRFFFLL